MIIIRLFQDDDWPFVWQLISKVFRAGETYAVPSDISEFEAHDAWIGNPLITYVAEDKSRTIVGTYYLKANFPGTGSHVCNCGYIVRDSARGQGVASQMCNIRRIKHCHTDLNQCNLIWSYQQILEQFDYGKNMDFRS